MTRTPGCAWPDYAPGGVGPACYAVTIGTLWKGRPFLLLFAAVDAKKNIHNTFGPLFHFLFVHGAPGAHQITYGVGLAEGVQQSSHSPAMRKVEFDPLADFKPVARLAEGARVFASEQAQFSGEDDKLSRERLITSEIRRR